MSQPINAWFTSVVIWVIVLEMSCGSLALAQNADDDEPAAVVENNNFEIQESNFDQWVFGNSHNAQQGRQRIDRSLTLQIEDVDRACKLSDDQRKKLLLAGRGDVKRFFDEVERVRAKFLLVRKDQQKFNEIWQDIQPIQMRLQAGLYGDESFFYKTISATLNPEQTAGYHKEQLARRTSRYYALIELWVTMLENTMPMRNEQRQKLLTLLRDNTTPPKRFGQYGAYLVMYQAAKIPENKLRPLFDDAQWRVLEQQLQQGRGMEQFLKQNKLLPE